MKYRNIAILFLAALIFTGCRHVKAAAETGNHAVFRQQGNEIIRAIAERDFGRYQRNGGDVSGIAAGDDFISSCEDMEKRMGKVDEVEFLTTLETPGVINLVYRIGFCRKTSQGKDLKHQQLFQLIFGRIDGKSKLLGMRIM